MSVFRIEIDRDSGPALQTYFCTNEDCEHEWEAPIWIEFGHAEFTGDLTDACPECGAKGRDSR